MAEDAEIGIATPDALPWIVIAVAADEPGADCTAVWFAAVAAPVGSGKEAAEMATALWSEAMTTGREPDIVL